MSTVVHVPWGNIINISMLTSTIGNSITIRISLSSLEPVGGKNVELCLFNSSKIQSLMGLWQDIIFKGLHFWKHLPKLEYLNLSGSGSSYLKSFCSCFPGLVVLISSLLKFFIVCVYIICIFIMHMCPEGLGTLYKSDKHNNFKSSNDHYCYVF